MKRLFLYLIILFGGTWFTACDYLDIVPDEREQEKDAFTSAISAEQMLYSCYGYMPNPGNNTGTIDYFTGDEVVTCFGNIDGFAEGSWSINTSMTNNYYSSLYAGIRQCWLFLDHMDDYVGIEDKKENYKAQCHFLIGYYHMRLMMGWGPIILVDKVEDLTGDLDTEYRSRNTLAECVDFICKQFDEAINSGALQDKYEDEYTGLATKVIAQSMKAYTLMYYASPIFNGNANLASKLINPDGTALLSAEYDAARWENARVAYKEAIKTAHEQGYHLFQYADINDSYVSNKYPDNPTIRALRANMVTPVIANPEEIWTYYFDEGEAGLQRRSMPFIQGKMYNGVAPTLNMIRRFYTENGLPCEEDPDYENSKEFDAVEIHSGANATNTITIGSDQVEIAKAFGAAGAAKNRYTSRMNLHREPRFYAWIAFQGGWYELDHKEGYDKTSKIDGADVLEQGTNLKNDGVRLLTEFLKPGNCGKQTRNQNYSYTGYLNKKGVNPDSKSDKTNPAMKKYPFPILRLANLYLAYAECAAECGVLGNDGDDVYSLPDGAKAYINAVRTRAGIPTVDQSWNRIGVTVDKDKMVEIVRQERQIELYLECQNFWDLRRWLRGEEFQGPYKGLNADGETIEDFSRETDMTLNTRNFTEKNYFFPFPSWDVNNNTNCIQNPGY